MVSDWTIFNYVCDDDVIGVSTFDYGKELYFNTCSNINICVLNKTFLSKSVCKIINNSSLKVEEYIDSSNTLDMTDPFTLYNFIIDGMKTCPAKKYCLFINCHSQGWFMKHYKYDKLTVTYNDLFKKIKQNNIFFEFIVLSSCHTATLEVMYDFRNITNYLIGCENPSPFFPFMFTKNTINIINSNLSTKDICINIVKDYIQVHDNPDRKTSKAYAQGEPDVSVIDVKQSEALIQSIIQFDMSIINIKELNLFRVCPNDIRIGTESFVVYDLYSIINHYFKNDPNYKNFIKCFNKALVIYLQSNNLKNHSVSKYSNGIGYTPCPYEHQSRGMSYLKMDIYKYHEKLLSNCSILSIN
jgi:hypothetical protein